MQNVKCKMQNANEKYKKGMGSFDFKFKVPLAQSKNVVIYHRGERRVRRVLRLFQSLLGFSGASAFSVCSAVKFKDIDSNFTEKFDCAVPFNATY